MHAEDKGIKLGIEAHGGSEQGKDRAGDRVLEAMHVGQRHADGIVELEIGARRNSVLGDGGQFGIEQSQVGRHRVLVEQVAGLNGQPLSQLIPAAQGDGKNAVPAGPAVLDGLAE
jgi:hypothetical protein